MLNLTASMAVAFRQLAREGFRPRGDLIYFAVADEESGSAHGARWMADHEADAIRADYVLTENGGLHSGPGGGALCRGQRGREGRGVATAARAGHARPRIGAVSQRQRAREGRGRRAAARGVPPAPRFHELWRERVETLGVDDELAAMLLDPAQIDAVLAAMPSSGHGGAPPRVHAHHVLPERDSWPGEDERDPRLHRHRGRHPHAARRGRRRGAGTPRRGARRSRAAGRGRDLDERPREHQHGRTRRCGTACSAPSLGRSRPRG